MAVAVHGDDPVGDVREDRLGLLLLQRDALVELGPRERGEAGTYGEEPPQTDGREGLKSLELLIAMYRSARDGRKVNLSLEY